MESGGKTSNDVCDDGESQEETVRAPVPLEMCVWCIVHFSKCAVEKTRLILNHMD